MDEFEGISKDKYVEAIYNSVEDNFLADGKISEENVPLEFLALVREVASVSGVPDGGFLLLSEILPNITDETPDIVKELAVIKNEQGLMKIVDRALFEDQQMMEPLDVDANIAPVDEQYGRMIDAPRNLDVERPSMPVSILSDDQLAIMQKNIKSVVGK